MRRILIKGELYDVSEQVYIGYVRNLVAGYFNLAEIYHRAHVSGFSDWRGKFRVVNEAQGEMEKSIVDQLDDNELLDAYASYKDQFRKMIEIDNSITEWLKNYVGFAPAQGKNSIKTGLARRLNYILSHGIDGKGPQGPIWVTHLGYQALVETSDGIIAFMNEIRERLDQRICLLEEMVAREGNGDGN